MPEQAPNVTVIRNENGLQIVDTYQDAASAYRDDDGALVLTDHAANEVGAIAPGQWVSFRIHRPPADTSKAGSDEIAAQPAGPLLEYVSTDGTRYEITMADLTGLSERERALAKSLVKVAETNLDKRKSGSWSNGSTITFTGTPYVSLA